jgi:hypothetical protein
MSGGDRTVPQEGELILYRTANDAIRVEVLYESETFWLDQRRIAALFAVEIPTISYHLKEIYAARELSPEGTLRRILRVQREGNRDVRREIEFYNLDAIISAGYRVNSAQATQFRIWATQTLREFIVKGFVLDDERLKLNKRFGKDYFDELLERIREIRASERRFYLKITDIYEQCSVDYDPHAETTKTFFKTVQNKLHWAVTGKTAAEIIAERADASKPSMGLHRYTADADYEPDFVVETETEKLLCEPKSSDRLQDPVVRAKARAAAIWCRHATTHEAANNGKPWRYVLIPHDAIADNMTVAGFARSYTLSAPDEAK